MITHAVTELGRGTAATRASIAEYILDCYSGLPVSHDALLSAHLRRLVSEGVLRTNGEDATSYAFNPPAPAEEKLRGPGRRRKDSGGAAHVPTVLVEKRGRGRPRKSPLQGSLDKATQSAQISVLPAKRKRAQSPTTTREDTPLQSPRAVLPGDDDYVANLAPAQEAASSVQVRAEAAKPLRADEARDFQNGGDATPVQSGSTHKRGRGRPRKEKPPAAPAMSPESGNAGSTGVKRGRGRPRKEKPSEPAVVSPMAGSVAAASRGFKRGCGRPSMVRALAAKPAAAMSAEPSREKLAAAAMHAETRGDGTASAGTEAGGWLLKSEKLVAAVTAVCVNRGHGSLRKEKPPAAVAGVKRSCGRPRKDQCITGLVEAAAVEELFGGMMTEASTRGGRPRKNKPPPAAMPAEKGDAASAGTEAGRELSRIQKPSAAISLKTGDAASMGIKRPRGRPRKNKPVADMPAENGDAASAGIEAGGGTPKMNRNETMAAAMSAEIGDAASAGIEASGGTPRIESSAARSPETGDDASTWVKRPRGRPRKYPAAPMSVETGGVVSIGVKRGHGCPRKKKQAPPVEGKRSRGRPRGRGEKTQ
ncbi:hypothetical protein QYE76_013734 [Lolium multiflorum]|uniref:H15 domain-containing protein n=1 Tax=Lolium multiflorum TaxID=4521 RepID=A0AAD8X7I3_LOLMU|nr:hypothetical protein QYE76_013734 [Lolium multiflorum]